MIPAAPRLKISSARGVTGSPIDTLGIAAICWSTDAVMDETMDLSTRRNLRKLEKSARFLATRKGKADRRYEDYKRS